MATAPQLAAADAPATDTCDAVVVGAGFAGLYQLYRFREQGLSVRLFEAGSGVGGTWYWNRYPGARVDAASHIYQYFFSDELLAEWDWHEKFPGQPDLERYLNFVADRFDLRRDIAFNTRVAAATWDEADQRWAVTTGTGETVRARFLAMCTGGLSAPVVPPFPGHASFAGQTFHTSHWPKEGVDFAGKRVGVIGTGATGVQVIQTIASQVGQLTVFQRTPPYTMPMGNPAYDDAARAEIRARYPALKAELPTTFTGFDMTFLPHEYAALGHEERVALLEELWTDGTLRFWIAGFMELFFDPAINEEISEFVRRKLRARIADPALAKILVPTDYGFGLKRVPLENGYYEAYARDNVRLVDLRAEPIVEITAGGVRTAAGEYPLDMLIMATGFDAGTGALSRIDITGRDGARLGEGWARDGVSTTFGLQVHGFPNMFMTMAPFSPASAFCNVPVCAQQQVEWISDAVAFVRARGARSIEPTAATEAAWVAHHDEVAAASLVAGVGSWYTGANIAGKKRRLLVYLGGVGTYAAACEEVKAGGYAGFTLG